MFGGIQNLLSVKFMSVIGLVLVGIGVNIFSWSLQECLIRTALFVIFVYLPISVFLKIRKEQRSLVKTLSIIVGLPVVLLVSIYGVLLVSGWSAEPWCADAGLSSYFPGWYKNPITRQCSYKMVRVCDGDEGQPFSFWFSPDQCTQEEREKILLNTSMSAKTKMAACPIFPLGYRNYSREDGIQMPDYCTGMALRNPMCIEAKKDIDEAKKRLRDEASQRFYSSKEVTDAEKQWGVSVKTIVQICGGSLPDSNP